MDDIVVNGKTEKEHDEILIQVFESLEKKQYKDKS